MLSAPNGYAMARRQLEHLVAMEQRLTAADNVAAAAAQRSAQQVATLEADAQRADSGMINLRSEHAAKLGELEQVRDCVPLQGRLHNRL